MRNNFVEKNIQRFNLSIGKGWQAESINYPGTLEKILVSPEENLVSVTVVKNM